jgi:KipI family sensor histidine kinase inhibitor
VLDIKVAGENAIIIYLGNQIAEKVVEDITFFTALLKQELGNVIIDIVPSYTSIMLSYRLDKIAHKGLCEQITMLIENNTLMIKMNQDALLEIPVLYDTDVGLDLADYLHEKSLNLDTLIKLHTERDYMIYAVGFSPAFAYLGTVEPRIETARLETPRVKIPAGSVGIADNQTAVYPISSSGGWKIIGRTPLDLSLANPDNINLFKVGDKVRFRPIQLAEFLALGGEI